MKKESIYFTPVVEIVEVAIESGIAQSGAPAPGTTGAVVYDQGEDHYEF